MKFNTIEGEMGWNTLIVLVQTCMSKFISPNSQAQTVRHMYLYNSVI